MITGTNKKVKYTNIVDHFIITQAIKKLNQHIVVYQNWANNYFFKLRIKFCKYYLSFHSYYFFILILAFMI